MLAKDDKRALIRAAHRWSAEDDAEWCESAIDRYEAAASRLRRASRPVNGDMCAIREALAFAESNIAAEVAAERDDLTRSDLADQLTRVRSAIDGTRGRVDVPLAHVYDVLMAIEDVALPKVRGDLAAARAEVERTRGDGFCVGVVDPMIDGAAT